MRRILLYASNYQEASASVCEYFSLIPRQKDQWIFYAYAFTAFLMATTILPASAETGCWRLFLHISS